MPLSYDLFPFVSSWENILKKPEDIVFAMNIGSMSDFLLDFDRKEIQNKSYEKEVLRLIQKTISENGIETNILRRLKPSSIRSLENPIPLQPTTKTYHKHFKSIHDSYNNKKFINSVKIEMLDSIDQNNTSKLNRCIFYLIRSLLSKYSLKNLEKTPKRVFARNFFKLYQNNISNKIISKSKKDNKHYEIIHQILNESRLGLNPFSSKQKRKKYLEFLHLNYPPWQRDMFYVILNFKNMIKNKKIIQNINSSNNLTSNKIYHILNQKFRKEFISTTEVISLKFIHNILHKSLGDHSHQFIHNLSELEFSKEFSSMIKSEIDKNNTLAEYYNFQYNVAESAYWVFVQSYSNILFSKIPKFKLNKLTTRLLRDFSKFLFNEMNEHIVDSKSVNKFELNRIITIFAREVCHEIFENILHSMKNDSKKPTITKIEKSFIDELLTHFFKSTDNDSFFQKIPDLSKKQFKFLITSFCKELQKDPQKIRVSCLVGGLSCEGKVFQIGNVTFYDPRIWDFGEDMDFDLSSGKPISISENLRTEYSKPYEIIDGGYERKRNSARAMVEVIAYDFDSAIEQADVIVQQSVDSLVFASSAFTKRGLKSQIPVDHVVFQESNHFSSHSMGPRKLDPDFLKIDDEYLQIAKFHDEFLRETTTKLNNLLYRSLNWYNRGHWSDIPHEKFVLLYIALEQLILGQICGKSRSTDLLKYIPKLVVTWRKEYANYGLQVWLNGITKNMGKKSNLRKFLDTDSRFQDWDKNYYILLENISAVRPFTKGESRKCVDLILNEMAPKNTSGIKHNIQINRSLNKFKIALLKSKRNSLIHEAVTYSSELNIMSKELERILVSVISPLVRFRNKKTLNKIIFEHNRPFQVKDRKY